MTAAEIRKSLQDAFDRSEDLKPFSYALIKDVIAKNAYQWTSATQSSIQLLPFTGHSTQAVSMNKGAILKYVVNTDMEGDARFTIGAIPDYTNQKGDMRISVMIDDQEPVTISLKMRIITTTGRWIFGADRLERTSLPHSRREIMW